MFSSHSLILGTALVASLSVANAWTLVDTFDAGNFFSEFNFFTASDPTEGYVEYVPDSIAGVGANTAGQRLVTTDNNQVYLGVDHTEVAPTGGRESVRLTSNQAYTQGLFIADIEHMPTGCGTWPAYWMFGPNWPNSGEIDIIEGVNAQTTNQIDLHTAPGCNIQVPNSQGGTNLLQSNCNQDNAGTGCGVSTSNTNNFGVGFNNIGGGVYAMQWAGSGIYIWFFERGSIPGDISANEPNIPGWGTPLVTMEGCDIDQYFANNNIVFDTTFCGQWAGSVWGSSSCSALANTCEEYVANNPGAFQQAYWLINSVKVYQ